MRARIEAEYKARQKHDCACVTAELTASQDVDEAGGEGLVEAGGKHLLEADGEEVGKWMREKGNRWEGGAERAGHPCKR